MREGRRRINPRQGKSKWQAVGGNEKLQQAPPEDDDRRETDRIHLHAITGSSQVRVAEGGNISVDIARGQIAHLSASQIRYVAF